MQQAEDGVNGLLDEVIKRLPEGALQGLTGTLEQRVLQALENMRIAAIIRQGNVPVDRWLRELSGIEKRIQARICPDVIGPSDRLLFEEARDTLRRVHQEMQAIFGRKTSDSIVP